MANWKNKIEIAKEWKQARDAEITVQQLAQVIVTKLKDLPIYKADRDAEPLANDLDEIIDEFEWVAKDEAADDDEFDNVMDQLYDWADTTLDSKWPPSKLCWIATF